MRLRKRKQIGWKSNVITHFRLPGFQRVNNFFGNGHSRKRKRSGGAFFLQARFHGFDKFLYGSCAWDLYFSYTEQKHFF